MRLQRKIPRPSGAMVVACIALFASLATGGAYAANSVFSSDIVDGEVKSVDLGPSSVSNAKLATGAVSTDKIALGQVTNSDIGTGAVTSSKLGTSAVTNAKIAAGAVSAAKLAPVHGGAAEAHGESEQAIPSKPERYCLTTVDLYHEQFDTGGAYAPGEDALKAPSRGVYLAVGHVVWAGAPGKSSAIAGIRRSGSAPCPDVHPEPELAKSEIPLNQDGSYTLQEVTWVGVLAAGAAVELAVNQSTGHDMTVYGGPHTSLSLVRLGGAP